MIACTTTFAGSAFCIAPNKMPNYAFLKTVSDSQMRCESALIGAAFWDGLAGARTNLTVDWNDALNAIKSTAPLIGPTTAVAAEGLGVSVGGAAALGSAATGVAEVAGVAATAYVAYQTISGMSD